MNFFVPATNQSHIISIGNFIQDYFSYELGIHIQIGFI